jgi:6-phosphogluconolactonase (cycloisomerase 2 family)
MAATTLLAGCGNFWEAPNNSTTSFTLTPSGTIVVAQGSSNTETITVTPGSSFTGTVTLSDTMTGPSTATSATDPTITYSSSSLTFSSTTAQSPTLTVAASSSTPIGAYTVTVTGVSGSVAASTKFCVAVGVTTSSCTSTASSGKFYILNDSSLTGYTISSGTMTAISGTLTNGFVNATAMAISSGGNYLFVASNGGITPFTVDTSTGALTKGTAFDTSGTTIGSLAVDPAGRWLLAASTDGYLYAYPLTSGTYTSGSTVYHQALNLGSGALYPNGIAISPSGYSGADIVAVAMGPTGTGLFTFTSSETSGPLSEEWTKILSPIGSSGAAVAVAIDPQNRLLYIGETSAYTTSGYEGALRVYNIKSSKVDEFTYTTAYAPAGTGPHAILPSKDGIYVYAASWDSDKITGYSVSTSALTALSSTIDTGTEPNGLVEDSTGGFLLGISYGGSPTFDAYSLSGGTLTLSTPDSTISTPVAIVAAPK